MSLDATIWAWKQNLRPSHKLILLALADKAGANDTAWPSQALLQSDTGLNRKTVIDVLDSLMEIGLIRDTGVRVGSTGSVKVYQLIGVEHARSSTENGTALKQYRKRDSLTDGSCPKNGRKLSQKRTEAVPKTGHRTYKEPIKEPIRVPPEEVFNEMKAIVGVKGTGSSANAEE